MQTAAVVAIDRAVAGKPRIFEEIQRVLVQVLFNESKLWAAGMVDFPLWRKKAVPHGPVAQRVGSSHRCRLFHERKDRSFLFCHLTLVGTTSGRPWTDVSLPGPSRHPL